MLFARDGWLGCQGIHYYIFLRLQRRTIPTLNYRSKKAIGITWQLNVISANPRTMNVKSLTFEGRKDKVGGWRKCRNRRTDTNL